MRAKGRITWHQHEPQPNTYTFPLAMSDKIGQRKHLNLNPPESSTIATTTPDAAAAAPNYPSPCHHGRNTKITEQNREY